MSNIDFYEELKSHPELWSLSVGFNFIKSDINSACNSMQSAFEGYQRCTKFSANSPMEALAHLLPIHPTAAKRLVLLEAGMGWTYVANSRAASPGDALYARHYCKESGSRAVHVSSVRTREVFSPEQSRVAADPRTKFVVYEPSGDGGAIERRYLSISHTQGKWRWNNDGTPFDFEHQENYKKLRAKDRFTREMLLEYCDALNLHPFSKEFYGTEGYLLEFNDWHDE